MQWHHVGACWYLTSAGSAQTCGRLHPPGRNFYSEGETGLTAVSNRHQHTHVHTHCRALYVLWTNHWSTRGFPVSYISHIYSAWMTDKTIYTLPSSSSSAFSLNLWAISLFKKTQMKEIKDCPRLPAIGPGEYIGFDVILLIWSIYLWFTSALDCLFGSSCQVIDVFINFWEPNWCWAWIHLRLLISQRALRPHNERVAEETQKPERFR